MPNGVYLGWRMFGYEYDDQQPRSDCVCRLPWHELLATVLDSTNYLDSSVGPDPQASLNVQYSVAAIIDGETQELSRVVTPWPQDYLRISPGGSSGGCHPRRPVQRPTNIIPTAPATLPSVIWMETDGTKSS